MHSDDLAEACVFLMNLPEEQYGRLLTEGAEPLINIGVGADVTIRELAELVRDAAGFTGKIVFDTSRAGWAAAQAAGCLEASGVGVASSDGAGGWGAGADENLGAAGGGCGLASYCGHDPSAH